MDYKKYNDDELIYMVKENYEDSANILFKKYYPIIHSLSYEYYSKYNGYSYELDDFYQEALSAFYKALHNYNNSKNVLFYTFVVVCIRRALASFGRIVYNDNNKTSNINVEKLEGCIEDSRENPLLRDSYRGLENIIKKVIFSLSLEAGAILELKINGFTYKEISELLDIPISSVEFKSRRARRLLRDKVKAYYCK